jgi:hypothetical protein
LDVCCPWSVVHGISTHHPFVALTRDSPCQDIEMEILWNDLFLISE